MDNHFLCVFLVNTKKKTNRSEDNKKKHIQIDAKFILKHRQFYPNNKTASERNENEIPSDFHMAFFVFGQNNWSKFDVPSEFIFLWCFECCCCCILCICFNWRATFYSWLFHNDNGYCIVSILITHIYTSFISAIWMEMMLFHVCVCVRVCEVSTDLIALFAPRKYKQMHEMKYKTYPTYTAVFWCLYYILVE